MNSIFNLWLVVGVVSIAVFTVWADSKVVPVEQCTGESFDGLKDRIQVIPCGKTRCKLPRNENITVKFKFSPKKEVKTLFNNVYAEIAGIPLPFIGVTGTEACAQVTHADTGEPASCPLAAGQEYLYTNVFPILSVYPTVRIRVHWDLHDGGDKVICFEVPAAITQVSTKKARR